MKKIKLLPSDQADDEDSDTDTEDIEAKSNLLGTKKNRF